MRLAAFYQSPHKSASAMPNARLQAQFRQGTGSPFDSNSWVDRNKMNALAAGGANWADNAAARAAGSGQASAWDSPPAVQSTLGGSEIQIPQTNANGWDAPSAWGGVAAPASPIPAMLPSSGSSSPQVASLPAPEASIAGDWNAPVDWNPPATRSTWDTAAGGAPQVASLPAPEAGVAGDWNAPVDWNPPATQSTLGGSEIQVPQQNPNSWDAPPEKPPTAAQILAREIGIPDSPAMTQVTPATPQPAAPTPNPVPVSQSSPPAVAPAVQQASPPADGRINGIYVGDSPAAQALLGGGSVGAQQLAQLAAGLAPPRATFIAPPAPQPSAPPPSQAPSRLVADWSAVPLAQAHAENIRMFGENAANEALRLRGLTPAMLATQGNVPWGQFSTAAGSPGRQGLRFR